MSRRINGGRRVLRIAAPSRYPAPTLSTSSQSRFGASTVSTTLTAVGGFTAAMLVTIGGYVAPATYSSPTSATVTVPEAVLARDASHQLIVYGNGVSQTHEAATFTVTEHADNVAEYHAGDATLVTLSGDGTKAAGLIDASGANHGITNSDDATRPLIATVGGRTVLRFDTTTPYLESAAGWLKDVGQTGWHSFKSLRSTAVSAADQGVVCWSVTNEPSAQWFWGGQSTLITPETEAFGKGAGTRGGYSPPWAANETFVFEAQNAFGAQTSLKKIGETQTLTSGAADEYSPYASSLSSAGTLRLRGSQSGASATSYFYDAIWFSAQLTDAVAQRVRHYMERLAWGGHPTDHGDLFAWFRGDANTITIGTGISAQADKASSYGAHGLTQVTGSRQPARTAASANFRNRPVDTFDGADDYLTAATAADWSLLHDGTGCTIVLCARSTVAATRTLLSTGGALGTNRGVVLYYDGGNQRLIFAVSNGTAYIANVTTANATVTNGTRFRCVIRVGSTPPAGNSQYDLRINGVQKGNGSFTGTPSAAAPAVALRLGCDNSTALFLGGDIAEVFVVHSYLTDAQVSALETYLSEQYG